MLNAVLILDNLAMGGFQRLALDQGYALAESGYSVRLLILNNPLPTTEPSFLQSEHSLIEQSKLRIDYLGNSRLRQAYALNRIFGKLSNKDLLLSHSLRATLFLGLRRLQFGSNAKLITTIHQLPTLSAPRQRFQRYLYAQFTDELIGYSVAVQKDWAQRICSYPKIIQRFLKKPMRVVRNGIYLSRLPSYDLEGEYRPRLIYLGRNTSWKGVDTFFSIASHRLLKDFEILMMVPSNGDISLEELDSRLATKLQVLSGKTIAALRPHPGDVHIYPANYGSDSNHIESVSLNCLELAAIGIPSILTEDGTYTWPDLEKFNVFRESDWISIDEVVDAVIAASLKKIKIDELNQIRDLISVQNNIQELIKISTS